MSCNSTIALFEEEVRKFQEVKNANVKKAAETYEKRVNWWIQLIVKYCAKMKVYNIHSDIIHITNKTPLLKSMHAKIITEIHESLPEFTISINHAFYIRIVQNDVQPKR